MASLVTFSKIPVNADGPIGQGASLAANGTAAFYVGNDALVRICTQVTLVVSFGDSSLAATHALPSVGAQGATDLLMTAGATELFDTGGNNTIVVTTYGGAGFVSVTPISRS